MARPREFDKPEALRQAMPVFWRKGYEGTSLADLLEATGLSKSSLYATFGDKRTLFLAAFDAYRTERMRRLHQSLNDGQPVHQSIEGFFRRGVAHAADPTQAYGCMTANQAVELAPHDVDVQRLVAEDFQAVEDAFSHAIARGQADGSITSRDDPRKLARFLYPIHLSLSTHRHCDNSCGPIQHHKPNVCGRGLFWPPTTIQTGVISRLAARSGRPIGVCASGAAAGPRPTPWRMPHTQAHLGVFP
jgi:TetR/AcrR family transcriptional repressor of nem operon